MCTRKRPEDFTFCREQLKCGQVKMSMHGQAHMAWRGGSDAVVSGVGGMRRLLGGCERERYAGDAMENEQGCRGTLRGMETEAGQN